MNYDFLKISIIRHCQQPRTFEYISKNVNGLDPILTLSILKDLEAEGKIVLIDDLWVIKEIEVNNELQIFPSEKKSTLQKYMGYFDFLKTPHPLDYEWRNSTTSLNRLTNKIQNLTKLEDKWLFMGMPTLFATAILKDIPNKVTLIERNTPIIEGLKKLITDRAQFKIIEADIFKVRPEVIPKHFCVIMDPPWYSPHFFQFMWLAAKSVAIGGMIGISMPPINTRPDISSERLTWFEYCRKLGLCIEALEPQQLEYAMPFFEFNALRAGGISNILPFWRKGDFALFRKVSESAEPRPQYKQDENHWEERQYKNVRIRIKFGSDNTNFVRGDNQHNIEIHSIIKGDILPTVSSRDTRRDNANVWTSGNRIFHVSNPELFLRTLDIILRNEPSNESEQIVCDFVKMVNDVENREFDNYLNWIYYEMERQST